MALKSEYISEKFFFVLRQVISLNPHTKIPATWKIYKVDLFIVIRKQNNKIYGEHSGL